MRRRAQRRDQRGFAMLLVFAMAAAVVVTLYLEAPRLAQQALRSKEQLLIDRGEQYQRAIQVFARTVKKYPQTLDELEKFQDKRYLRRRYKDPFTGEEEWRLIHSDAAGVFTDSKVYGPKKDGEGKESKQTFIGELGFVGRPPENSNDPNAQNPAMQRRASDRPAVTSGQGGGENQQADPNAPADPNQPAAQPGAMPGMVPGGAYGVPAAPGQPGAAPVIPSAPGVPGMPSFRPANPIQTQPQGQPGTTYGGSSASSFIGGAIPAPGGVSNSQQGGVGSFIGGGAQTNPNPGATRPTMPGSAGGAGGMTGMPGGLPSGGPGQVPAAAADLIRQILTTPRQGGMPGTQGVGQGGLGAGIAGVASKRESTGIKIYNERTRYDEWEFLYDQSKDLKSAMGAAGVNSQGTNQPGAPLQGSQPGGTLNPGGPMSGPGGNSGMGSQNTTPSTPSTGRGSVGGFIGGTLPPPPPSPKQ